MSAKTIRTRPSVDELDEIEKALAAVKKAKASLEKARVHTHRVLEQVRYGHPPADDLTVRRVADTMTLENIAGDALTNLIFHLRQLIG